MLTLLHLFSFPRFSFGLSPCVLVQVSPLESELNLLNSFVHKESSCGRFRYQVEKERSFKSFRAASETQIVLGDVAYPKKFCPMKLFKAKD